MFHSPEVPTHSALTTPLMNPQELVTLLNSQDSYFRSGATLSYQHRQARLDSLGRALKRYESRFLEALQVDLRKHRTEAYVTELGLLHSEIREAKKNLKSWMKAERVKTPITLAPSSSYILKEPLGRILIISPWNYPLQLAISPLIGALAAGNVCVLKPSELAPTTSHLIAEMIEEIFPHEVCRVLEGGVDLSKMLLERRWDHIFFTGSPAVGRAVAVSAAQHLTPCVLELGGKSPCIVTANANLKLAARRIIFGKFMNAGQTCVAPDYILVESKVHEELVQNLKQEISLRFGHEPLKNPQLPRIINARHFQRLCTLLHPELVAFGGHTDPAQLLIAPTLLTGVSPEDPVMQEEIFGPILPILKFESLKEAKNAVLDQEKPLALYLFSNDKREQNEILHELSYGGGCINDTLIHCGNSALPFGGVGTSGMGAYHGKHSFDCFSHRKAILKSSSWMDMPLRYHPWTRLKDLMFRLLLS